jgi:hypothetical protein
MRPPTRAWFRRIDGVFKVHLIRLAVMGVAWIVLVVAASILFNASS